MSKIHAAITGVQGYVPDYVLTNAELEKMVDTNDEWIRTRTGIQERRILKGDNLAMSDMGVEAVKGLLEKTNTDPSEVDLLICGTITADMVFPDTANTICDKVGIHNAFGFDINAACSGFLFSLITAAQYVESGRYKKVIVVGGDVMSSILDFEDRSTCIIFGDGCGAVMLEPNTEGLGIQDHILRGDGSGRTFLHMKAGGSLKPASIETVEAKEHSVYQEGRTVFRHAVRNMVDVCEKVIAKNDLTTADIDWVIPHQANTRIITSVAEGLNFPMEKVFVNIHKYGNTTAGTLPLCLWENEKNFKKGDKVILTAFGGGFTWGSIYLTWAY